MHSHQNLNLSHNFINRVRNTFGEDGESWIQNLPERLSKCASKYKLTIHNTFDDLSYNFTAPATLSDGRPAVIKLGVSAKEINNEKKYLQQLACDDMVQLFEHDDELGLLILEQLKPGKTLATEINDETATVAIIDIMKSIIKPVPNESDFPTTQQWYEKIDVINEVSPTLTKLAINLANELHRTMGPACLLHGDLHHFNILSAKRSPWIAIDPKGVIGEAEFEVGALLRNPLPDVATKMNFKKITFERVAMITDMLGYDRERVLKWGFVQAMFAAIWCRRIDDDLHHPLMTCAQQMAELLENI